MKKDIGKWCDFQKIPTHNIDECCVKQSLGVDMKFSEFDACSDSQQGDNKRKNIINVEPSVAIATTKVQNTKPQTSKGEGVSLRPTYVVEGFSNVVHC